MPKEQGEGESLAALKTQWRELMKIEPPSVASRAFMARALAHERQLRRSGDLSGRDQAKLRLLAGLPANGSQTNQLLTNTKPQHKITIKLVPGTRLLREWNGKSYQVSVIEEGFVYRDKVWSSLSAIAKDITGAHWSGPRFFGIVRRVTAEASTP